MLGSLGLGLITLEKQGISQNTINIFEYHQTNSLQKRLQDYLFCLENISLINPQWAGKIIFWGESEGGILATNLAAQTPLTAAVLLFAVGGGMKHRDEVKWELYHRLEQQQATQEEIDSYMGFLEKQMQIMILEPTPDKQFLGNTYKWWASFLNAEEGVEPLDQLSLPICLVHGVEDVQVPVESADLAAAMLSKTNTLTYLRLQGYGHNLDSPAIDNLVYQWLKSLLFEQKSMHDICTAQITESEPALSQNIQKNLSEYTFNRGRGNKGENHGDVYGKAKVDKDTDGKTTTSIDVGVKHDFGNGCALSLGGGFTDSKDKSGNSKGELHGEIEINVKY